MNSNQTRMLAIALKELYSAMPKMLNGTKLKQIEDEIRVYAISAAVAGAAANILPGVGGLLAVFSQCGIIWMMYASISKTIGLPISKNLLKYIGSAVATEIITGAGTILLQCAAAGVLSFIPGIGQAVSAIINTCVGYILVYVSAVVYLKILTSMANKGGVETLTESEDTKKVIKDIISNTDMETLVNEGKAAYKKAKANGEIDAARKNPKCPTCGSPISLDQKFCQHCGGQLK